MCEWFKKVEIAETREDLLHVCRLRYHVYVDELKRDNYNYIDNVQRILEDPLDHVNGVVNLLVRAPLPLPEEEEKQDARIILSGCARLHVPMPEKYNEMFGVLDAALFPSGGDDSSSTSTHTPNDFAFFSRFMVKAEYRGRNGTTDALYQQCYIKARAMGAKYLLLNCTPSLASAYERKGWVRYKNTYWDEGMGMQIAMCLPLEDVSFLSTLGSFSILPASLVVNQGPCSMSSSGSGRKSNAENTAQGPKDRPKGEWLTHILNQLEAPMVSSRLCSPLEIQKFMHERIPSEILEQISLFKNTTAQERMTFLGSFGGCVPFIKVQSGDKISRAGDVRDEAFLVMSGRVRIEYEGVVLNYLGPGSLIGEHSFLSGSKRALDVKAEEDVELMVIARITFLKAMKYTPELALKALFNMACVLSQSYSENMAKMYENMAKQHSGMKAQQIKAGGPTRSPSEKFLRERPEIGRSSTMPLPMPSISEEVAAVEAEGADILRKLSQKWNKKEPLRKAVQRSSSSHK